MCERPIGSCVCVFVCERVRETERGEEFLKWAPREKKKKTSGINNLGITCVVCVRKKKENNKKKKEEQLLEQMS